MEFRLLTAQELADALSLSVETVWRYTREKKIPVVKLGRQYRFNKDTAIRALTQQSEGVNEKTFNSDKFTYDDYVKLPDEPEVRIEVLDGLLVREPSPNVPHQLIIGKLHLILTQYFHQNDPHGMLFLSPLDVTLSEHTVVQPDLIYVAGSNIGILRKERIDGAPDLVVEVLSESNRRKDRVQKMELYRKARIPHYWIVDPQEKTMEAFVLKNDHYTLMVVATNNAIFTHDSFPGLDFNLGSLFDYGVIPD